MLNWKATRQVIPLVDGEQRREEAEKAGEEKAPAESEGGDHDQEPRAAAAMVEAESPG
jgi:hypothetical protein